MKDEDEDPIVAPAARPPLVSAPGALDVFPRKAAPLYGQEREPAKPEDILTAELDTWAASIEASLDDLKTRGRGEARPREKYAWASELHSPCLKQLVHARRDWKEKKPPSAEALWRMQEGTEYEKRIRAWLLDVGYELFENQGYLRNEEFLISGKIDGTLSPPKKLPPPFDKYRFFPAEIKSINPIFWDSVKTIEAIKNHRSWWIQKYPSQLNFYIREKKAPAGLLVIGTFGKKPRVLPMLFDPELWERDIEQLRKATEHLTKGTLPPPIPFDSQVCGMCDFAALCNPLKSSAQTTDVGPDDEIALNFYLDLKEAFEKAKRLYDAEHNRLIGDSKRRGRFYGHSAWVGDIEIKSREVFRKEYSVKAGSYIVTTINRIRPED